jgi:predicted ester cyclase
MSVQENKEFIRQYYSWDAAKVLKEAGSKKLDLHDPGFMYHAVTGDLNLEQYGQMMQMLSMAFPDWKQTVEDIVAEGDNIAVRTFFTGTHQGTFLGIPPTGKKVAMKGIVIYKMKNGKLVEGWSVSDMFTLMQQIGVIPKR